MRAAWYERQGPASEVLRVGEMPIPEPGPDEVRVRVAVSGIHDGDLGKRRGWWGSEMTFPRVAAGLGIPGITAHRAIFTDGPVTGTTAVVTGAVGAVGRAALAVARRGGATVIATVRQPTQIEAALAAGADHVVDTSGGRVSEQILELTGEPGVDRGCRGRLRCQPRNRPRDPSLRGCHRHLFQRRLQTCGAVLAARVQEHNGPLSQQR
jgi:NADPH2:quinone reductase